MDEIILKQGSVKPKGAILIDDSEVLLRQTEFIRKWKNKRDTFFLEYAPYIVGAVTALTSGIITRDYRKALKLGYHGQFMMYLPSVGMPTALAVALHHTQISSDVLLMKTRCSLCLEMKAAALQSSVSVFYPIVLASIAAFSLANIYYTFPLPTLRHKQYMDLLKVWSKMSKPFVPKYTKLFGAQLIFAMLITYKQFSDYRHILVKTGAISEEA